jgi:hypothetical protein
VTLDGERAGKSAAKYVAGELKKQSKEINIFMGENIKSVTPQKIVGLDDVEVALRVKKPLENAELTVGHASKKYRVISPTEVIKVTLKSSDLKNYLKDEKIEVSCRERRRGEPIDD